MQHFKLAHRRKHKKRLISSGIVIISSLFLLGMAGARGFPPVSLPDKAPKHPTDVGRLSLLQVEKGQLVEQRDGTLPVFIRNVEFVDGRTHLRQAVFVKDGGSGIVQIPIEKDITLDKGTLAFWIIKSNWNEPFDDWFFRLDVSTSFAPNDNFQIRKYFNGYLYAGFESMRAVTLVASLNPNTWHHIAFTWETGSAVKLYIDGVLSAEGPVYDGSAAPDPTHGLCANVCWGGWTNVSSARAIMEDMQIFNYPLSAVQIGEIYNSKFPASFYEPGKK